MTRFSGLRWLFAFSMLLADGLWIASAGVSSEIDRCMTSQCIDDLALKHCFKRQASLSECRAFLESLEAAPRSDSRDYRLAFAAAAGVLAGRTPDAQEATALRKRQLEIYRKLVSEYPDDPQALMGLAGTATDRNERIALLKKVVAASPRDTIAVRTLNSLLIDGTPAEQQEAIAYLRAAYARAQAPHRWHLASMLYRQLVELDRTNDAEAFRNTLSKDIGIEQARNQLTISIAKAEGLNQGPTFAALGTLCESNAVMVLGPVDCVDALSRVSQAVASHSLKLTRDNIDVFAKSAVIAFGAAAESKNSAARSEIADSLSRLREAKNESPLLLEVVARFLASSTDAQDKQSALALLERAVSLDPKNGNARLSLGQFYFENGRVKEAITQLELAVSLLNGPPRDAARLNLVSALRRDGQDKRAQAIQSQIGSN